MGNPPRICDKCGLPVEPHNDTAIFDSIHYSEPDLLERKQSRHLLPHYISDGKFCEGSPSRAQFLPGQPVDPRSKSVFRTDLIDEYRQVYRLVQLEHPVQQKILPVKNLI